MTRILFVCFGNICRSPMAEFIMKDLVKKAGLETQFQIESAATSAVQTGNPVYPPARRKLAEHGIGCGGKTARQLVPSDYEQYDLLIGMDRANLRDMRRICGNDPDGKIHLLMEYAGRFDDVARSDSRDESAEHEMVNEFLTLRPEAFQDLHSNFELLAKMQHYGLPTRLLDFTTNPLIALYFACEKNDSKSARVICCNAFFSYIDNEIIEALSSSYLPYSLENLKIEDLLLGTRVSAYEYISKLYLAEDYRLLFAKPRYWNQRIKNQSAIFLIYPNKLFDNLGKICYYQKIYGLDKEITGMENTEENRNRILEVARRESIESIYPIYSPPDFYKPKHMDVPMLDFTVTHQSMRSLFSQYERDNIRKVNTDGFTPYTEYGAVSFDRRFLIVDQIQGIDSKSLENQFCSVVIDAKHKSYIREELGNIGIDKAFVYPELEYTAEKIKKKYLFE